jgi:threonine synthase
MYIVDSRTHQSSKNSVVSKRELFFSQNTSFGMIYPTLSSSINTNAVRSISRNLFFGANPRILPQRFSTDTEEKQHLDEKRKVEKELPVTYADISRAHVAIRSGIKRSTCEKSYFLSELIGANLYLKTEFRQFTGSFKERGARNALLYHLREQGNSFKNSGAIAASAGNHALALAYHGQLLGVPVTVVMPHVAPLAKVDKCKRFGARVIIEGGT